MTEQEKRIEEMSDKERTVIGMEKVLYPLMKQYSDLELLKGIRRGWNADLERLYDAGYRKADEIFAKCKEKCMFEGYPYGIDYTELVEIFKEFGVEVEE